jgi:hypothetical protein
LLAGLGYGAIECDFLSPGESAECPLLKRSKGKRANGYSNESKNFDSEGVEHAADVAVPALVEDNLDPGVFLSAAQNAGALGAQQTLIGVESQQ